ncbi:MAG: HAMP domain-containing sensor histidine kinase [Candidimonas sp.]
MRYRPSLASRVVLSLTILVVTVAGFVCLTAFYVHAEMEQQLINSWVRTESFKLKEEVFKESATLTLPFKRQLGPFMMAWGESPSSPAPDLPEGLRELDLGLHSMEVNQRFSHVMVAERHGNMFYVMYDSSEIDKLTSHFGLVLIAIALFVIAWGYILGLRLSRWAVRPLNDVADQLDRWAPGSPLTLTARYNEGGRLLHAFNRMQDRIDRTIADQKEFASNLHHEIRTPLAVIRGDAELLSMSHCVPPGEPDRPERIMDCVDEISETLESTYNLSRAEEGPKENVQLRACVDDVLGALQQESDERRLRIHNHVPPDLSATVNRYALMMVVRNITRNAILHGSPGNLHINGRPGVLTFSDDGPGISPTDQLHIFERYYSRRRKDERTAGHSAAPSAGDVGIGLAVAQRTCALQSWRLEVASPISPAGGTRFTLALSEPEYDLDE